MSRTKGGHSVYTDQPTTRQPAARLAWAFFTMHYGEGGFTEIRYGSHYWEAFRGTTLLEMIHTQDIKQWDVASEDGW
jgi:hypothetical protein